MKIIVFIICLSLHLNSLIGQTPIFDTSFGNEGMVLIEHDEGRYWVHSILETSDKDLLVFGSLQINNVHYPIMQKLDEFGKPDSTFFDNSIMFLNQLNGLQNTYARVFDVEKTQDSKLLLFIAGYLNSNLTFAIVKIDEQGNLDTSYGNQGIYKYNGKFSTFGRRNRMRFDFNNKILVGGSEDGSAMLLRVNENGTLDSTFNSTGIYRDTVGISSQFTGLGIDYDNSIYLTKNQYDGVKSNIIISKLTNEGIRDFSFGDNGELTIIPPIQSSDNFYSSEIEVIDNCMLVSGTSLSENMISNAIITKLDLNGNIDTSFGSQGFEISTENSEESSIIGSFKVDDYLINLGQYFDNTGSKRSGFLKLNNCLELIETNYTDNHGEISLENSMDQQLRYVEVTEKKDIFIAGFANFSFAKPNLLIFKLKEDNFTTSIRETLTLDNKITLYPNPTSNYINFEIPDFLEKHKLYFQIYNTNGRIKSGINPITKFDISYLDNGIYAIIIKDQKDKIISIEKISIIK